MSVKTAITSDPKLKQAYDSGLKMALKMREGAISQAPMSNGKKNLLSYFSGKRLTPRQSIQAQCCECLGFFSDGRSDCENYGCSLYPYMPYGIFRKKYTKNEKLEEVV